MKVKVFMGIGCGKKSARVRSDLEILYVSAMTRLAINTINWTTWIAYSLFSFQSQIFAFCEPETFRYHTRLKRHG